jgi:cytochrome c oxidase cbb3-type subunit I
VWRATEADGSLTYSFVESVKSTFPFYAIRLMGGLLYLSGMLLMAYNVFKTVIGQTPVNPVIPEDLPVPSTATLAHA